MITVEEARANLGAKVICHSDEWPEHGKIVGYGRGLVAVRYDHAPDRLLPTRPDLLDWAVSES